MKFFTKIFLITIFALSIGHYKLSANGCTGSWFNIQYSPWCGCYQVCGNYISDCDELVSVTWNFGDGTPSITGGSPCHVYSQPGTYTVTMTVVAYCHNSFFNLFTTTCHITQQITVTQTAPILDASFYTDTTCLGTTTHFTNTTVYPPGSNNTYTWYFGDGTTATGANPAHMYDSCGAYDVMMIVTNSTPCCAMTGSDTVWSRIYVNCNPFDFSNDIGDADPYIQESSAQISVQSGSCPGDTTRFLLVPQGPIVSWEWLFPDSSTSTSLNPAYVYYDCPPAVNYTYINMTTNRGCEGILDSVTGIFCPSNVGLNSTTALCTGQCSGTATVSMSGGGTPPYSYSWSDSLNQTNATAVNLCPGAYTVTVTDGNGCSVESNPVTVNDFPNPFVGVVSVFGNVLCYGENGGSAVINYSGGTSPYNTFWPDGSTADTVVNLPGGINIVNATDAHGCTFSTTFVIPQPPPITATIVPSNASCGLCNGSATVTASGGSGSFIYRWLTTPVQTTQTATGLCAGVYRVVVEDAAPGNCRDTFSVAISEIGAQPVTASATSALCSNICDGTATATLTGGCANPPCNIVWLDSAGNAIGQTNITATNLCAGTYTVRVTNSLGCRSFADATVTVPNPILVNTTSTTNTCSGTCNGGVATTSSGGGGTYTYQWFDSNNNPLAGQTASSISGLCAGSYRVRVTDQQGCSVSVSANVLSNPLTANASSNAILCNGECTGIVNAFVTGGRSPYTYTLVGSGGGVVYNGSSFVMANLCADNYTLTVTDAGNCNLSLPVSVTEPQSMLVDSSNIMPTCFGSCNGTVAAVVAGATSPYTYEWRNSQGSVISTGTNSSVSNLCAGNYVVQVTDANGCVSPYITIPLIQPEPIQDSMNIYDPYCVGGQGSIDLTVWGGTPGYSYSWNNGTYTTQDIGGLSSGTYTVQITDANNCNHRDSATFVQLPPLNVNITATLYNGYHFKCNGGDDGEVKVNVTGGLPPYTFLWNDSAATTVDSIYGLTAGTYTVTVTDSHGCVNIDSIALDLIPPPFFVNHVAQNVLCADSANGSIDITPSGGVPPYVFYWQHDSTQLNVTPITNLDTGRYIVNVYDGNFCLIIDTIAITQPQPLIVTHTKTDVTCNNGSDGTITITASGGTPSYSYSWNSGQYNIQNLTGITAGSYQLQLTDSNSCSITSTITISEPPAFSTSISTVQPICFGINDGSLDLTVSGGVTPYTFDWNNGTYNTEDLQGLGAGFYQVVITDSMGCASTDSATIANPNPITGNRQITICDKDSFYVGGAYQTTPGVYIDTLSASNNCDSILSTELFLINQYSRQLQSTVCFGQQFYYNGRFYSAPGTYSDTLQSSAGCDSVITIELFSTPDIGLFADPATDTLIYGDSVQVNILSNTSAGVLDYTWSPLSGITCGNCSSNLVKPTADTRYVVIAIDTFGCYDTVSIPIIVEGGLIFIPNVFTPNGDGVNDIFRVFGKGIVKFRMRVFDRWGEKVFETTNPNEGWDGTYKGVLQNPAVYVYIIDVNFADGNGPKENYQLKKGSVTLLR